MSMTFSCFEMLIGYEFYLSLQIAAISMIFVLATSGLSVFIWMAKESWEDLVGVSIGIVFLLLAVGQVAFTMFWHMRQKRIADVYEMEQPKGYEVLNREHSKGLGPVKSKPG